jgi:rhamnopyranosyl-N-acetylglucosaminyl-diphospho-decaprenol beta-1,3/1,4-galactofuranosyltransferase
MERSKNVAVVIVTYNRKELLAESLEALLEQTYPINRIILIDNASTDGTKDYLKAKRLLDNDKIDYKVLNQNLGGAGGFYEGIKVAYEGGYEWFWIMDDDTIPTKSALEKLFDAHEYLKNNSVHPMILASRVNWTDNTPHPMNYPHLDISDWSNTFLGLQKSLLPLRAISFVSIMIHRQCVEKYGYPMKKYFIWNDDAEYTARILKNNNGFLVSDSVVIHKTQKKYSPIEGSADRYFYEVRNKIWMTFKSKSWTKVEKIKLTINLFKSIVKYVKRNKFSIRSITTILKGILFGVVKSPN